MSNRNGRPGAIRKAGTKKGPTQGSGGQVRRGLRGKKATPKAEDRVYHKAHAQAKLKQKAKHDRQARLNSSPPEYVLGRNPIIECLQTEVPASSLYVMQGAVSDEKLTSIIKIAADRGLAIIELTKFELERMVSNTQHQGVALQVPPYRYAELEDLWDRYEHLTQLGHYPIIVALDNITDPRNLGAVIRSALAFNALAVMIPGRRSAGVTAVTWRTSAGAAAHLPVVKVTNFNRALMQCADQGFQIVGLEVKNAVSIDDYTADSPTVIVVGSEGKGLSRLVRDNCDTLLSIPMHEHAESLNASVAASIVMSEFNRQHRMLAR